MNIIEEKWDSILYTVKEEHDVSEISFKTWLKPLTIANIDEEKQVNVNVKGHIAPQIQLFLEQL